jgi:hypothetical protein
MRDTHVLRRANGDLFTEEVGGRLYVPVWSSEEAALRYKERNPELLTFFPVRLDRRLMRRITSGGGREATTEFFLLSDDDPDADLYDGRPVSIEEIFPEEQPAQLQV